MGEPNLEKCLAFLVLRRAGCSQDAVASIMHCAKLRVVEAEHWFKKLPYSKAVELCSDIAIKRIIDIDLVPAEQVGEELVQRVAGITGDNILRHYRQDYLEFDQASAGGQEMKRREVVVAGKVFDLGLREYH